MADQTDPPTTNTLDAELLLKQARSYLAFGEQLAKFSGSFPGGEPNSSDWGGVLQQHFDQFKAAIVQPTEASGANPELARLSTLTLDIWQQTATALGVTAPKAAEEANVWEEYQQVQGEYLALLRQAATQALDLMEQQLSQQATAGQRVGSLRELYNLWVDCNEKTYGQLLRSNPYAEVNGRLFNTLLHCYARGAKTP